MNWSSTKHSTSPFHWRVSGFLAHPNASKRNKIVGAMANRLSGARDYRQGPGARNRARRLTQLCDRRTDVNGNPLKD